MYKLPFNEEWLTFWGGDSLAQNHHYENKTQKFAYDFIQVNQNGSFYRTNGKKNDDYYSFGKEILAPRGGQVYEAVDGIRDNTPMDINTYSILGNHVVIKHSEKEYSVLAHLRQGSICAIKGSQLSESQKVGECGNSGYSSDPHLHFHVQDSPIFAMFNKDYKLTNVAGGVSVTFKNLLVNGKPKNEHSPVKGDFVKTRN